MITIKFMFHCFLVKRLNACERESYDITLVVCPKAIMFSSVRNWVRSFISRAMKLLVS
jgi:hypothetical protein